MFPTNYRYENPNLPQSVQWNVGTQMVMPFAMAADLSYVGQHASHVHQSFQSNSAININAVDFGAAFLPIVAGGRAASLFDPKLLARLDDDRLVRIIRAGMPATGMPAFDDLTEERMGQLIHHIRAEAFLPDGRLLVTERSGNLRVIDKGTLSEPVKGTPKVSSLLDTFC